MSGEVKIEYFVAGESARKEARCRAFPCDRAESALPPPTEVGGFYDNTIPTFLCRSFLEPSKIGDALWVADVLSVAEITKNPHPSRKARTMRHPENLFPI